PELTALADALSAVQDTLATSDDAPPLRATNGSMAESVFRTKSEEEYLAVIRAGVQRRTRSHERLIRHAGAWFQQHGATVSTPHPRDMLITNPVCVLVEAKIVGDKGAVFAVREAVGQLFEYRYFLGPADALLCVLLDEAPGQPLCDYVEQQLNMLIAWWDG